MDNITDFPFPETCPETGGYRMGMGKLGDPSIDPLRKFRWVAIIEYCYVNGSLTKVVPSHFIKTASRPDLTIEDTEINFLNAKTWISGKPSFEQVTFTYLDVNTGDNIGLWEWIGTVYNFFGNPKTGDGPCYSMGKRRDYEGIATIQMLDGCGFPVQDWVYRHAWPTSIKFGDLDYASADTVDIEITMRYSEVEFYNRCGRQPIPCYCSPCPPARQTQSLVF